MKPRYGLVTYATNPNVLVRVSDAKSSDADWIIQQLDKISYDGEQSRKGIAKDSLWGREGVLGGVEPRG